MSNAEYLSRPFPLLAKLAAVLRNIVPVRKAFVRFAKLLRGGKESNEPLVSEFVGDIPDVAGGIPGIIDEAPPVADEASEVTDEIPGGAGEALDAAADDAPAEATDDVPEAAHEAEVPDQTPGTADEAPNSTGEAPAGVFDDVPVVGDEAPEITGEIPGAADEASNAIDNPPAGVADDVPEVADETPEITGETPGVADQAPAIADDRPDVSEASEPPVVVPAVSAEAPLAPVCSLSAREQLIRRRWAETGIKMWAGLGALNIQGSAELLPLQPGATRREYDRLEFRLIAGAIVCEGVVVDPPSHRK